MPQNQVVMIADAPLSQVECRDLARLEQMVDRAEQAAFEASRALKEINERRLYRVTHKTFEAYCQDKWGLSVRTAYDRIEAAGVFENVRSSHKVSIQNENQARQLIGLQPEKQREAWAKAVETAPKGKVTAAHVAKVVEEITGKPPGAGPGEVSDKMLAAFKALKPKAKAELMQQCKNETMEAARVQKEQPKEEDEPKLHRCPVCKGKGEIGFKVEWSKA